MAYHLKRVPPKLVVNRVNSHNPLQPPARLRPHQARHVRLPALSQPRLVDAADGDGAYRQQLEDQALQLGRRGLDGAAAFAESAREVRIPDLRPGDLERGGQEGQHRQPVLDRADEVLELGVPQPPVAASRGVHQPREALKVSKDDDESAVHEAVDELHATGRAMPTSVGYGG